MSYMFECFEFYNQFIQLKKNLLVFFLELGKIRLI